MIIEFDVGNGSHVVDNALYFDHPKGLSRKRKQKHKQTHRLRAAQVHPIDIGPQEHAEDHRSTGAVRLPIHEVNLRGAFESTIADISVRCKPRYEPAQESRKD